MADTEPIVVDSNAAATEVKPTRTRGNVNATQLAQLTTAENIALAAQRSPYATLLVAHEITAAAVITLLSQIGQCRDAIANGVQATADRATATREEKSLFDLLITLLRQVQAAANQKYARDAHQKPQLRAYWIGSGLAVNRASLEESSHAILEKLQTDTLPGITAEFKATVRTTRQAWMDANQRQAAALTLGTQSREETTRLLKAITDERLKIQFAIDAAYPIGAEGSDAVRAEFGIPKTRPFRVR